MHAGIAIAGATGFVGRALIDALGPKQPIIGLSRRAQQPLAGHKNVAWRACNLLSLQDTERALAGAKVAIYLVHSMAPQATLTYADFEDMDLICADNFARAAKTCGIQHIIYLSGLVPHEPKLSRHLTSRLEVEQTFKSCGVRLTTLRAGMVIGPGGSSFRLMSRLVDRLPFIVAPKWTQSKSQAVALRDVIAVLTYALDHPEQCAGTWDIGCPDVLTYREMMAQTAEALGKKARIVDIPYNAPAISLLGVSLITHTPRQLVMPLVQSLQHTMVAEKGLRLQERAGVVPMPFKDALHEAITHDPPRRIAKSPSRQTKQASQNILCVQRMTMPPMATAAWTAQECIRWLPKLLRPLVQVVTGEDNVYRFCVPRTGVCLLELTFASAQSSASRQLFYVSGGFLAQAPQARRGCFEFRAVLDNRYILLIVHDFVPRLRWLPYKASQAALHASVMNLFGRHLRQVTRRDVQRA